MPEEEELTRVQKMIVEECDMVKNLLLAKNKEYGNSALEPINVFSSLSAEEQIDVRIDDKLKRIQNIKNMPEVAIHEDTEQDLIGYLILMRVARRQHNTVDGYCVMCNGRGAADGGKCSYCGTEGEK